MNDSPLDQTIFDELRDATGADFVVELVETFLDEAPAMIAELRSALADDDADAFRRAAHSIKSNANVFGAMGLAEIARKMELEGTQAADLPALEAAFAQTAQALRNQLDD